MRPIRMFRSKGDNKNIETKWICELKKRNHTEKTFEETIENNIELKIFEGKKHR